MLKGDRGSSARECAFLAVGAVLIVASVILAGSRARAGSLFPQPTNLEPNVKFWVDVFTRYSVRDFVIHDRAQVGKVYEVLHLPGDGAPTGTDIEWANAYLKAKYSDLLNRLASGKEPVGYKEREIADLYKGGSPDGYAAAAQNLRVQEGLRERFHDALLRSRNYRPTMERIFRASGIPPELVALAAVESGYYNSARSYAGAVGVWQFTRATGSQYLKINRHYDERLNPIRSTEAAAQLLRYNYDLLGNWPLAITAYNYGTYGMARAAENCGSDLGQVIKQFNGPHFGFASKNYYAEFLAALEVHEHEDKYFPGIASEATPPPQPVVTRVHYVAPSSHRSLRSSIHRAHQRAKRHHKRHQNFAMERRKMQTDTSRPRLARDSAQPDS